ncbi:MAG TPA: DUF58 domain-containing protein [Candidatus Polarisedimenticolia bacterium]|nr:DUF58 domain-containing protein [Candidatus Polarisedimenticolia bacterium]
MPRPGAPQAPSGAAAALPREMIRRIRRIEIRTRRLVNESMAGEYHSVFRGRGMEFSEVREYQVGDDIRTIDWNVTSRMGHPYVKKFVEERELTVALVVDSSASGDFGSAGRMKGAMAAEVSALLAFSAIQNNDRVGLLQFTDRIEKYVPPKKGRTHVLRVIRELLFASPASRGTDIGQALDYAMRVFRRKAVMFLISDFLASGYEKALRRAARRHDLIAIAVTDPREESLPPVGLVEVEDAETGEAMVIDTLDERLRREYRTRALKRRDERRRLFRTLGIDAVELSTDRPYDVPLVRFFDARARRARA